MTAGRPGFSLDAFPEPSASRVLKLERKRQAEGDISEAEISKLGVLRRDGGCASGGMSRSGGNAIRYMRGDAVQPIHPKSPAASSLGAAPRLGALEPYLLALQLRPVEELDRAVALVGVDLDEGEAVQDADVVDRVVGQDGALAQRPAQVLLGDAAALAAVDEELDRVGAGGGGRGARVRGG